MLKYATVAVAAALLGFFAPIIYLFLTKEYLDAHQRELLASWSSEGKNWSEFSKFIEAGGRAYWAGDVIFNDLSSGVDEEEIRKLIGPPDAVLVGQDEIARAFILGPRTPSELPNGRLDYIPYLDRSTSGIYLYKMGRIARRISEIETTIMRIEFSSQGKSTAAFAFPVSTSNPVGDYSRDTRSERRIRGQGTPTP